MHNDGYLTYTKVQCFSPHVHYRFTSRGVKLEFAQTGKREWFSADRQGSARNLGGTAGHGEMRLGNSDAGSRVRRSRL
jgi:hypothetical protein